MEALFKYVVGWVSGEERACVTHQNHGLRMFAELTSNPSYNLRLEDWTYSAKNRRINFKLPIKSRSCLVASQISTIVIY